MITRGKYQVVLSPEHEFDLADLSPENMEQLKILAQQILLSGDTQSVITAYLAAYTQFIMDLQLLSVEPSPGQDLLN